MRTHAMCLAAALVMCVAGCASTGSGTEPKEPAVRGTEELAKWIPAESVVTVIYDGDNAAARKTALHDLFEDPQMKAVFDGPLAALKKLAVEEAKKKGGPDLDALLPLLKTRIAFAFVGLAPPAAEDQPPQPEFVFVVKVGEPGSPAAKAAALLVDSMARDMQLPADAFKPAKIAGVDAKVAKIGPMTLGYATAQGHFVLGVGNALAKSLNSEVPKLADSAGFRRVSQVTGGNEVILVHYAHTAFMQKFAAGIPRELSRLLVNPEFGLSNVKSVSLALAPMDRGFRLSLFVHAPGEKRGILKVMAAKPLSPDIIRLAPKDSDFFCARSIDPAALWDFVVAQAAAEPDAKADYDKKMAEAATKLGFDLRKDFVASIGDEFAMFGPPFVVAVKLRDQARFTACVDKALAKIAEETQTKGGSPEMQGAELKLNTMTYEGCSITYVDGKHFPLLIQPCYMMAGDYAVFAFNPVGLKSYILTMHDRLAAGKAAPKPSLAENEDFKALRSKLGPEPAGIYYARSVGFYRQVYDWMPMLAGLMKMAPEEAQAVVPDSAMLPPFEDISKHFFNSVAAVRAVDDGILLESYSPFGLPAPPEIGMGGLATTSILAGMLLPALSSAREAARQTKDMSNLKQIGLAVNTWMITKGNDTYFPPSLKSLLDDGMLSDPRVLIAPGSGTELKPGQFVTDYEYVFDMIGTKVSERDARGMPIVWDKEPFYNGGRNVLFSDCHVEFMDERTFQRLMEEQVKPWVEKMNEKAEPKAEQPAPEGEEKPAGSVKPAAAEAVAWTCSMHPQVRKLEPGKCPICEMDLVPVQEKKEPVTPPADKVVPDAEKPAEKGLDNF